MEIISVKEFGKLNNTAVTIGKFDGLHRGHQTLISKMVQLKEEGFKVVLFTFKKSPKEILKAEKTDYILTPKEKISFLENRGIDYYIEYPCDEEVLATKAEDFLKDILIDKIGAKKIVCGTDFHFGKGREGDVDLLKKCEEKYGYEVIVLNKLKYENEDISSSRVREATKAGNVELVNELLGYTYTVIGQVVSGNRIGRTLGFPTANIIPEENKLLPTYGVYYTKANIDGKIYKGVTNVGKKPTIDNDNRVNIETCFLDYEGDLYNRVLEIEFYKYVRPEQKFESLEMLKAQINRDVLGCLELEY